ncbi:DUF6093 family protein [Micromonospora sp. NPDC047730]|uniref:DUF6093 family protein n=1 Tax=Micromonospora sp. NPDC047730 TaxID=3364253 RepID=UPI00371A1F83
MSVEALLARGRAASERLMVDACVIRRKTGETTDEQTGVITPVYATLYTGKCRVQQAGGATPAEAGEAYRLMLRLEVQVPMSIVGLEVGDEVELTSSPLDPDLVGRTFFVRDLAHKTHATARRVGVEEATS